MAFAKGSDGGGATLRKKSRRRIFDSPLRIVAFIIISHISPRNAAGHAVKKPDGKRYAWMAFSAICIMSVMWVGIQYNCMNLYAAPVVDDLGISRTQFMAVLSIPAIISASVSLLCFGAIEEHLGLHRMLLIGGIFNTLAFVCWFFMDSVTLLYLGGALYGCGCSITAYNSVAAGVNRWFKRRMGSLMGLANALGNVAGIVFAMVIAALISTVGWRYSFGFCIALSTAATIACVALYRGNPHDLGVTAMYEDEGEAESKSGETASSLKRKAPVAQNGGRFAAQDNGDPVAQGDGAPTAQEGRASTTQSCKISVAQADKAPATLDGVPFRQAICLPRMWLLAFGYLLLGTTTYGLMSTLPLFAVDLGLSQFQGPVVSASLLAAAIMMVPLGAICDRLGTRWAIALCCLLTVISALLLRFDHLPLVGLLISAICAGAAYSACGVCVGTGVKEAFGEVEFGKKLGVCSGFSYIGLALGPALINFVRDMSGTYAIALLAFAVLAAITALIFFTGLHNANHR